MPTYMESEIPTVINSGANNGNGFWGGDGIWALLAIALLAGGGFGGFGFGGGFGGRGGFGIGNEFLGYQLGRTASQEDVAIGFNNSSVLNGLNQIKEQQYQAVNYNNQGFAGLNNAIATGNAALQQTLCQGFNGINTSILQSANATERGFATTNFNLQNGVNQLANQIASCCCDLKTMNLENRYLNEKQTCEIVGAINDKYQRLMDWQVNEKLNSVMAENASLKGQISNYKQTNDIVTQLRDPGCPVASYNVPNPNCCYNPFGFSYGYANNNNNNCCGF